MGCILPMKIALCSEVSVAVEFPRSPDEGFVRPTPTIICSISWTATGADATHGVGVVIVSVWYSIMRPVEDKFLVIS